MCIFKSQRPYTIESHKYNMQKKIKESSPYGILLLGGGILSSSEYCERNNSYDIDIKPQILELKMQPATIYKGRAAVRVFHFLVRCEMDVESSFKIIGEMQSRKRKE